ncbi:MAG: ABC transporter permease [Lachnospiraceae bacterium]|nr:ABC transporter permease [Lachnospiraceae bacterium]
MPEQRKIPGRTANIRRSIATLTLALLVIYCVDNVALSYLSEINRTLDESVETRTMMVSVFAGYRHSGAEEYADSYKEGEEYMEEFYKDEKPEEFLAWLDASPDLYSYVEREVVAMKAEDPDLGWLTAGSYDQAAMEPYLLTEGCGVLSGNEALIAKYITSDGLGNYFPTLEQNEVFDGGQLVGQTISVTYRRTGYDGNVKEDVTCEIKIVGCYDNVAAGLANYDILMAADELKSLTYMDESEDLYDGEGNVIPWDYIDELQYNVVLKDYSMFVSFRDYVEEEFDLHPVCITSISSADSWILTGISFVVNLIMITLAVNSTLSLIYAIERDIRMRRREFMLLKAMGYRDGDVNQILFRETIGMIGCALGITMLAGNLFLAAVHVILPSFLGIYFEHISIVPQAGVVLLTLAIGFGAPLVGYLAGVKGLKKLESVRMVSE